MDIDFRVLDDSPASCIIDLHAKERLKGRKADFLEKNPAQSQVSKGLGAPKVCSL